MKTIKILLTLSLLCAISLGSFAQRKTVATLSTDTVSNTDVVFSDSLSTKLSDYINFQVLCTEIGGTSDGVAYLLGSTDGTSWKNITEKDGLTSFFTNDTLTIADAAIWSIVIQKNPWKYLKLKFVGTSSDTTQLVTKYTIGR